MKMYTYNKFSKGAKALAQALGIKRIKHDGSKFRGAANKKLINWGCSKLDDNLAKCQVFNPPESVAIASDKLKCFQELEALVSIPEFTTDREVAESWYEDKADQVVVCRTLLNSHSGQGIVISEEVGQLVNAPLYVKYIPKINEYRVHVFNGEVLDVQRKALKQGTENPNWKIRNHSNGFIFARNEGHNVPAIVLDEALEAVIALGLHFGAVDVVFNERQQKAYVLEVNTAPGLEGTTLDKYVEAFSGGL